jgi:signal transduction histidine kinase
VAQHDRSQRHGLEGLQGYHQPMPTEQRKTWALIIATGVPALILTLAALAIPRIPIATRSPTLHVGVEVAVALTGLLAAFLVLGRLRQSRRLSDLLLFFSLLLLGFTNLLLSALPAMIGVMPEASATWATAIARLLAIAVFAVAASEAGRRIDITRVGLRTTAAAVLTIVILWMVFGWLDPRLPAAVEQPGLDAGLPLLEEHPGVLVIQVNSIAFYALAAWGFTRRALHSGDDFMRYLAAASVLGLISRISYALYPSLYSGWFSAGDVIRLGFYALLMVGAGREIAAYWRGLAEAAAVEERRRMARDLHDGLAQELSFIAMESHRIADRTGQDAPEVASLAAAADRALDESRRAIAALSSQVDEPLHLAMTQAACEVADRTGVSVRCEIAEDAIVAQSDREDLLRITREAVANAGRHSRGTAVLVRLTNDGRLRLTVSDDGIGFDPARAQPDRFGLQSMRERAAKLGADFRLDTAPGRGTTVEVIFP